MKNQNDNKSKTPAASWWARTFCSARLKLVEEQSRLLDGLEQRNRLLDGILDDKYKEIDRLQERILKLEAEREDTCNRLGDREARVRFLERKFERHRNVSWPKPEHRLPKSQVAAAFNVPIASPLFAATMQEIDDALQELLDTVSQPPSATITEELRLHLAGGIEHLRQVQKRLLDLQYAANHKDTDLEDDKDAA